MQTAWDKFKTRQKEVNAFLRHLKQQEAHINSLSQQHSPDGDLSKILKASVVMLLYNMVEATVRTCIEVLYVKIQDDKLRYHDLCDELRQLWVSEQFRDIKHAEAPGERYKDRAHYIANKILRESPIVMRAKYLPVSGTLDAERIKKITGRCGIELQLSARAEKGDGLFKVKTRRNSLAHGDESFAECGAQLTISDLRKARYEIVSYCHSLLSSVEQYINDRKYVAQPAAAKEVS